MNDRPIENELKYILDENVKSADKLFEEVLSNFISNGFIVIPKSQKEKNQIDDYYDTFDFMLYNSKRSLRTRLTIEGMKATYKEPMSDNEIYASRTEIEESLINSSLEKFIKNLKSEDIEIDPHRLVDIPVLEITDKRTEVYLEIKDQIICLSLDRCIYENKLLNTVSSEIMIEAEIVAGPKDTSVLNNINEFMSKIKELKINKQSKYERGTEKTLAEFYKTEEYAGFKK